jgi:thiamine pyrophosphate-dependent acetolactate synthase large subunit-like protein
VVRRARSAGATLDRREVVKRLLANRGDALVVSGLGSPTYDVHAAGDDHRNYYLWGAMGSAALIGLGLAQAQPSRRVVVVTGDGEQLMGLGGLATIGVAKPKNLVIVVLDNGHFGETGMQRSHTGLGVDLAAVSAACGFAATGIVNDMDGVSRIPVGGKEQLAGPHLYVIRVRAETHPRSLPSRDAAHIKNRFMANFGLKPN